MDALRIAFVLSFGLGCFEHHVVDCADGECAVDASRPDAGSDVGFCLCASDLDCPAREGCVEYVCAACECRPRMVPRCGECMCVTDADCPPPPPFGDCVRAVCTDCICTFIPDDAVCGIGGVCDPDTFLCTSSTGVEVEIIVRTDYEPVVEFDRIAILGGLDVFEYRPVRSDPFLSMGVPLGTLRAPRGDQVLSAELWLGDSLVASRDELVRVEEGAIAAFTVARP